MLYGGAFGDYFPQTNTLVADLIGREWMALSRTLFYSSLYMPFFIFIIERWLCRAVDLVPKKTNSALQVALFKLRFLIACYFVVGATLACFIPSQ